MCRVIWFWVITPSNQANGTRLWGSMWSAIFPATTSRTTAQQKVNVSKQSVHEHLLNTFQMGYSCVNLFDINVIQTICPAFNTTKRIMEQRCESPSRFISTNCFARIGTMDRLQSPQSGEWLWMRVEWLRCDKEKHTRHACRKKCSNSRSKRTKT
jgi:hypothetical protein